MEIVSATISFLDAHGTAVQAISTVLILFVTAYYAWQTWSTVREIRKQRKDSTLPFVIAEAFEISDKETGQEFYCVEAKLKNLGKGAALNVLIHFMEEDSEEVATSSRHLLPYLYEGQKDDLHIHITKTELDNLEFVEEENGEVCAHIDCLISFEDIYGRRHSVRQNFQYERDNYKIVPIIGDIIFKKSGD